MNLKATFISIWTSTHIPVYRNLHMYTHTGHPTLPAITYTQVNHPPSLHPAHRPQPDTGPRKCYSDVIYDSLYFG